MDLFPRAKEKDLAVDQIIRLWKQFGENGLSKPIIIFGPLLAIFLFSMLISNSYGNLVAFTTLMISVS